MVAHVAGDQQSICHDIAIHEKYNFACRLTGSCVASSRKAPVFTVKDPSKPLVRVEFICKGTSGGVLPIADDNNLKWGI